MTVATQGLIIPLNLDLQETTSRRGAPSAEDLTRRIGNRLSKEPVNLIRSAQLVGSAHGSLLHLMSDCYSRHLKISLAPHDLWYVMLTEIAGAVNAAPNTYRPIFTRSPEKIEISVPTGDVTALPLDEIEARLRALVPVDLDLFLPAFSSHTTRSRLACVAAFADAVQSYYSYSTFACGLVAVEVRGTEADWWWFANQADALRNLMPSLAPWLERVVARVTQIAQLYRGGDTAFMKDIFRSRNVGSGGEMMIDGWFGKDFFHKANNHPKLENFPSTWSVVPFKNLETGRRFADVWGCFSTTVCEGFHGGVYDRMTFEFV